MSAGRYGVSRPAGTISFALMIIVHMARSDSAVARDSFWWPTTRGSISVIQHFHEAAQIEIDKAVDLYKFSKQFIVVFCELRPIYQTCRPRLRDDTLQIFASPPIRHCSQRAPCAGMISAR